MANEKPRHPSCPVGNTLEMRDGEVFVRGTYASDFPVRGACRHLFWPTGIRVGRMDTEYMGVPWGTKLEGRDGVFSGYLGPGRYTPTFRLPQGDSTQATIIEETVIPPPKVRKGQEPPKYDWQHGRWRVYSKKLRSWEPA